MPTQWFYKMMGVEYGPCTSSELKELANRGSIHHDSHVRKGVDGKWVSAIRVQGLFDDASTRPMPEVRLPEDFALQSVPITQDVASPPIEPSYMQEANPQSADSVEQLRVGKSKSRYLLYLAPVFLVGVLPAYSWLRNSGIRGKLETCESYGVIEADIYYESLFSSESVVFDLKNGSSPGARRIDMVHLLLECSSKLDLYSLRRVVLARNGRKVFYIPTHSLKELTSSYSAGGVGWAFNNLPENVRTMAGGSPYGQWTGGWLGGTLPETRSR